MIEAKRQLVQIWLTKAQHDLASADVLSQSRLPLLDTAIYHCQQAAEKCVKAFLIYCDHEVERVHDVEALIRSALPYEPEFASYADDGRVLTPYAMVFRYPGFIVEPSEDQFDQAYASAVEIYRFVLSRLPAEVHPLPILSEVEIDPDLELIEESEPRQSAETDG